MNQPAAVQHFARNMTGRDFVVGDIHGCFEQLQAALNRVGFDADTDRLFSVGDLVDRGPQSESALQWLSHDWFHACRGNHDDMVLAIHDDYQLLWWALVNGGEWWLEAPEQVQTRFIAAFTALPLAMEVEAAAGRVGIVHADVPAGTSWPAFSSALRNGDAAARETALWGRDRALGIVTEPVAGIDRVVCGHTINMDGKVKVRGNVWLIDTGAFLQRPPHTLTLLPIDALFSVPAAALNT